MGPWLRQYAPVIAVALAGMALAMAALLAPEPPENTLSETQPTADAEAEPPWQCKAVGQDGRVCTRVWRGTANPAAAATRDRP